VHSFSNVRIKQQTITHRTLKWKWCARCSVDCMWPKQTTNEKRT